MISFACIVQEGAVPLPVRETLSTELARIGTDIFGGEAAAVAVDFTEIPSGSGFRGGEPSRASLVSGSVPVGTATEPRNRFLREVSEMWCRVTGCNSDDLLVSAMDSPGA
jgi:hypothetical protein